MGCGCGGKKTTQPVGAVNRNTVYQVLSPTKEVLAEFATLQEARTRAVAEGGIVKVTSKS